jgi:uncharacterized damage-inducible protein DinB
MQTLLTSMLRYKAWADQELIAELVRRGHELPAGRRDAVLRLLGHAHVVDRIFVAHLQRSGHGYTSTEPAEVPRPEALFPAIEETDRWLVDHAARLAADELAERIPFRFTDGFAGEMSREEMLGHLIAHGGYHRGEIGQILTQQFGTSPPDTFTGYLRRTRGESRAASGVDQRFGSV